MGMKNRRRNHSWENTRQNSGINPVGFELGEHCAAVLLLELLDFHLGLLEAQLANLEQFAAFLELGQQLGQRHLARFHRFDDAFEFGQRGLKTELRFLGFLRVHPVTLCRQTGFSTKR